MVLFSVVQPFEIVVALARIGVNSEHDMANRADVGIWIRFYDSH